MTKPFPKIIHQVFGLWDTHIPKQIQKRIDKWKELHKDYEYILWDRKKCRTFLKEKYEWFLPIYDSYPYAVQKADSIRYFILYEYGGIYSDIDLEPYKCLTSLLNKYKHKNCILYRSANSDMITNDFMISKPGNVFWKKVFNELILKYNFRSVSKHLTIMYSTGPLLLDYIYETLSKKQKLVYIINSKYINNCDISTVKPARNREAFLTRYEGSSWHSWDSMVINFFYINWPFILIVIFLIIIIVFIVRSQTQVYHNEQIL